MEVSEESVKRQIDEVLNMLKNILKDDLLGVYLYGSLILGEEGKYSDIDILAVSNRATNLKEKELLEKELLKISGIYAESHDRRPIEIYILVKSEINPWKYPPKFDFLYGDWLRKKFESGIVEPWESKEKSGLAISITQLLLSNKILYGPKPSSLLPEVPYKDFISANTSEIDSLMLNLESDTRNVLLTLARIWATLETNSIISKTSAADFVMDKMPKDLANVMKHAKDSALGNDEDWIKFEKEVKPCAEFMLTKIKELSEKIDLESGKEIKLGQLTN